MTARGAVCAVAVLVWWVLPLAAQRPTWVLLRPDALRGGQLVTGVRNRSALPNDRAIPLSLIRKIERSGATVRFTSRWLQAVSVDADATALAKLRRMKEVRGLQPVGRLHADALREAAPSSAHAVAFDSAFYGPNWKAIRQLGIPSSHTLGFTGKDIRIAILDTGFEPTHEALVTRRVFAQRDFIGGDQNVANQPGDPNVGTSLDQEIHGTWVWSILGGYMPGQIVGPAYDASFALARVDLNQVGGEDVAADEDRWVAAAEWADSVGARIISSSLAYRDFTDKPDYPLTALDGSTTLSSRAADEAARRGILVVNAIGNFGPSAQSLWAPADADSIIAVGAVDTLGQPAVFANGASTSRGPTADGRLKPELVALGKGLTGAQAANPGAYDHNKEGTSLATPLVAGVAAMFMQAWPQLSIMAVRNALILSASRADNPDNDVGYGIPDVSSAILFPEGLIASGITGVNLQNQLTTIQPTFTWTAPLVKAELRPVRYRLEIASDRDFTSIVYADTVSEVTSLTVKLPMQPAAALWWRVVAEAFPGIRRTSRAAGPFSVPGWVRLLTLNSPAGSFTDSLRPVFRWEPLAAPAPLGPFVYDLQILNGQTGAPLLSLRNLSTAVVQPSQNLTPNVPYRWRVIARTQVGIADTVESLGVFVVTSDLKPPATLLYQNFPNPFPRPELGETSTHVWFDVNTTSSIELAVYDTRGRLVRQLIPALSNCGTVTLDPGQYGRTSSSDPCVTTDWDGRDARGSRLPRGVYIMRLRADGTDQIKRIVFTPPD